MSELLSKAQKQVHKKPSEIVPITQMRDPDEREN